MSYTPTHLTLQGIVIWTLLSKKNKEYYKEHRWEFVFINLFAILPDIDLLFGYHRTFTHSLIVPSFFLLSLLLIEHFNKQTELSSSRSSKLIRFLKLAILMYMMHIFLDFSWDPILLFWPLNSNLYDLTVYLRFETKPWLFFPLAFVGLIPEWGIYTLSEGQEIFFINLSQKDRQAIYGQYLDLYIGQFTTHILLFVVWFILILLPAFRRKRKKVENKTNNKTQKIFRVFWSRIKRQLTLLGLFFIILGLVLGPIIGRQRIINYNISSNYVNTLTYFDPTLGVGFNHKPSVTTQISFQTITNFVAANFSFVILEDEDSFYDFFNSFENFTENYYDNNITYNELILQYHIAVDELLLDTFYYEKLNETTSSEGIVYTMTEMEETKNYFLITLVEEWNSSESFFYTAQIELQYIHDRRQAQIEGGILDSIGLFVVLVDQLFFGKVITKLKRKN